MRQHQQALSPSQNTPGYNVGPSPAYNLSVILLQVEQDRPAMAVDDEFGPGLVDTFDFTLLFEQSFFSLLPASIFIVLGILRILHINHRERTSFKGCLLWAKLVSPKTC